MLQNINININSFPFLTQLYIYSFLYILPLKHRPHFVPKASILFALSIALGLFSMTGSSAIYMIAVYFFINIAYCALCFFLCCNINVKDCIYGTMCAYASQHFMHSCGIVLRYICDKSITGSQAVSDTFTLPEIILYVLCFILCYFIFARNIQNEGKYNVRTKRTVISTVTVLSVAFFISLWSHFLFVNKSSQLMLPSSIYDMLCCLFILWMNLQERHNVELEKKIAIEESLRRMNKEQYKISKESLKGDLYM